MKRLKLIQNLKKLVDKSEIYASDPNKVDGDPSNWHREADMYLLEFINDTEITEEFNKITKWYD
jgi:hypothetical protein